MFLFRPCLSCWAEGQNGALRCGGGGAGDAQRAETDSVGETGCTASGCLAGVTSGALGGRQTGGGHGCGDSCRPCEFSSQYLHSLHGILTFFKCLATYGLQSHYFGYFFSLESCHGCGGWCDASCCSVCKGPTRWRHLQRSSADRPQASWSVVYYTLLAKLMHLFVNGRPVTITNFVGMISCSKIIIISNIFANVVLRPFYITDENDRWVHFSMLYDK